jgi:uncharacterized membrane protein
VCVPLVQFHVPFSSVGFLSMSELLGGLSGLAYYFALLEGRNGEICIAPVQVRFVTKLGQGVQNQGIYL